MTPVVVFDGAVPLTAEARGRGAALLEVAFEFELESVVPLILFPLDGTTPDTMSSRQYAPPGIVPLLVDTPFPSLEQTAVMNGLMI